MHFTVNNFENYGDFFVWSGQWPGIWHHLVFVVITSRPYAYIYCFAESYERVRSNGI